MYLIDEQTQVKYLYNRNICSRLNGIFKCQHSMMEPAMQVFQEARRVGVYYRMVMLDTNSLETDLAQMVSALQAREYSARDEPCTEIFATLKSDGNGCYDLTFFQTDTRSFSLDAEKNPIVPRSVVKNVLKIGLGGVTGETALKFIHEHCKRELSALESLQTQDKSHIAECRVEIENLTRRMKVLRQESEGRKQIYRGIQRVLNAIK